MYMPEHISGTGDAMDVHRGMEPFSLTANSQNFGDIGTVEAGHNSIFIPEEAIGSIYESADYMHIMERFADQFNTDFEHNESDPIRQIKTVRNQLKQINQTLDKLMSENEQRDRREQFIWAGLASLAVISLISLFRN
uniref:Uncharacterized protein n=1 Tax=Caenorhabditis japonica TaxID=281687 RepID=A0A8R1HL34_CAEJA